VEDCEHDRLGPAREDPKAADEPLDHSGPRIASAGDDIERSGRVCPLEVLAELAAFVAAGRVVVQLRHDDDRDVSPGEGDHCGFARSGELRDGANVDRLGGEPLAQHARLRASLLGQRDDDRRVAVQRATRAVFALRVPCEQQPFHRQKMSDR
jgi:hypothetical protein